ncbi:dipeptide ABC transporter ATP-binding protein [Paenibacillus sp. 481]|uniref:dipeptide ABC transporter ATP-binding protein n=1 Tax=Paenibacillus sp. 481 TaxID=2835869 RepID=UPI001E605F06|nr:ABC transporter ATP-binding protein [Paenibacillus sp. 481]UHA73626.1 ABC transporter ATP-binding protein [Paenibacillus sp. 481]
MRQSMLERDDAEMKQNLNDEGQLFVRAPDSEALLRVEQLSVYVEKRQQRRTLIHDVSLAIHPGETVALVGESGSGKSVIANAVLGLLPKALRVGEGEMLFQGENVWLWPEKRKRKLLGSQIGCVFQDYQGSFTPFMQLGTQLVETLRSHQKLTSKEAKAYALEWLKHVGLSAERTFNSYPFQLSGGQRQRAALAAAMMLEPALLIADEPTTALDVLTGELVLDLIAQLQRQTGCAVLLISHDLRHVRNRADSIAVVRDGRIVESGAARKICHEAAHPYTQMLLQAKPLLAQARMSAAQNDDVEAAKPYESTAMASESAAVASESAAVASESAAVASESEAMASEMEQAASNATDLLIVERVNKTYAEAGRNVLAVRDVSLRIIEGECVGVVGESGSGKSTLARLLLALERPDDGAVYLNGMSLFHMKDRTLRESRQHVQAVFQDPNASLNPKLRVLDSVMEPLDNFPQVKPPFLQHVRHSRTDTASELLSLVGLESAHLERYPHELSGGQRQRVAIARGISLMPRLLICDEPTSSLDVSVQAQMLQLLKKMQTKLGMAYLFISHDIAAVQMMSDRIIVMKDGQIVDQFASAELFSPERHEYTRQLVAVVS